MKNLFLLPTDKPSRLWTNNLRRRLELDEFPSQHLSNIAKHIYITSDEEIKEGDWYIFPLHKKGFAIKLYNSVEHFSKEPCISLANLKAKKIILTTDPSLAPNIQNIDDEFLEWFVKNPSCEEVETYSLGITDGVTSHHYKYEIIIPKEEPDYTALLQPVGTKQETLEEAAEKLFPSCGKPLRKIAQKGFIAGAKWQAEQMYSDTLEFGRWIIQNPDFQNTSSWSLETAKFNFEQFKKKA